LPELTAAQVFEKASPAVAMVLAAQSPGQTTASVGAALVVYADGDLLTSWSLIRNAYALQVRFKSGEVFDKVRLLSVDERRDVAAIRVTATGLTTLPAARAAEANPGDQVLSIFHPQASPWSSSTGVLSGYRMADEIPGAGTGFHVFQFTAPASPGVSGGVLLDSKGRALGLITGALNGGESLNLAVPIENVIGLADTVPVKSFVSGSQLVPGQASTLPAPLPPNVPVQPPSAPVQPPSAPVQPPTVAPLPAPDNSATSKDRDILFKNFKTMYVDASQAKYFGSDQMKAALAGNKEFATLNIRIVDDPKVADTILVVGYTFAWDYPFELKHEGTSIVLLAGKGYGPFSGPVGAASVASEFIKGAKPFRGAPPKTP
jgi:hypothetical protein